MKLEVLVAACEGSIRLTCATGLPIVHVDAVEDGWTALTSLNRRGHASGVRVDEPGDPIALTPGWDRWRRFPMPDGPTVTVTGVAMTGGRLVVILPPAVPAVEFREQLHGALRHLRLQDVGSSVAYLHRRARACAHRAVQPRYTPASVGSWPQASLVTDLYVVDPTSQAWRLFWIVAAARLASVDGRDLRWR